MNFFMWLINSIPLIVDTLIISFYIVVLKDTCKELLIESKSNSVLPQHSAYLVLFLAGGILHTIYPFTLLRVINGKYVFLYDKFSGIIYTSIHFFAIMFLILFFLKKAFVFTQFDKKANFMLIAFTIIESCISSLFIDTPVFENVYQIYSDRFLDSILLLISSFPITFIILNMTALCICACYLVVEYLSKSRIGNKEALYLIIFLIGYLLTNTLFLASSHLKTCLRYLMYMFQQVLFGIIPLFIQSYFNHRSIK